MKLRAVYLRAATLVIIIIIIIIITITIITIIIIIFLKLLVPGWVRNSSVLILKKT